MYQVMYENSQGETVIVLTTCSEYLARQRFDGYKISHKVGIEVFNGLRIVKDKVEIIEQM